MHFKITLKFQQNLFPSFTHKRTNSSSNFMLSFTSICKCFFVMPKTLTIKIYNFIFHSRIYWIILPPPDRNEILSNDSLTLFFLLFIRTSCHCELRNVEKKKKLNLHWFFLPQLPNKYYAMSHRYRVSMTISPHFIPFLLAMSRLFPSFVSRFSLIKTF